MKSKLLALMIFLCSLNASACSDTFQFAKDKQMHMAGSAAMAGALSVAVDDPWKAFIAAVAVGAAKEWYDYRHQDKHCASWQDFTYDVAGAAVGAYVGYRLKGWYIEPKRKEVKIGFIKQF